jgi:hypothetical protein
MKARNHNYWINACITSDMSTEYQSMDSWLLLSYRHLNIQGGYVISYPRDVTSIEMEHLNYNFNVSENQNTYTI